MELLEDIRKAHRAYGEAAIRSLEIAGQFGQMPRGVIDGNFAVRQAYHVENQALVAYKLTLRAYLEFTGYSAASSEAENLTDREREVLQLIAGGQSTKEVAHLLGITFKTAASHRQHILAKLHARKHRRSDQSRRPYGTLEALEVFTLSMQQILTTQRGFTTLVFPAMMNE